MVFFAARRTPCEAGCPAAMGGKRKGKGRGKGARKKRRQMEEGDEPPKKKGNEKAAAKEAAKAAAEAARREEELKDEERRRKAAARRAKPGFSKLLEAFGVSQQPSEDEGSEAPEESDEGDDEDEAEVEGQDGEEGGPVSQLEAGEGEEEEIFEDAEDPEEDDEDEEEPVDLSGEQDSGLDFFERFWEDPPQGLTKSSSGSTAPRATGVARFRLPELDRCEAHACEVEALVKSLESGGKTPVPETLSKSWSYFRLAPGLRKNWEALLDALKDQKDFSLGYQGFKPWPHQGRDSDPALTAIDFKEDLRLASIMAVHQQVHGFGCTSCDSNPCLKVSISAAMIAGYPHPSGHPPPRQALQPGQWPGFQGRAASPMAVPAPGHQSFTAPSMAPAPPNPGVVPPVLSFAHPGFSAQHAAPVATHPGHPGHPGHPVPVRQQLQRQEIRTTGRLQEARADAGAVRVQRPMVQSQLSAAARLQQELHAHALHEAPPSDDKLPMPHFEQHKLEPYAYLERRLQWIQEDLQRQQTRLVEESVPKQVDPILAQVGPILAQG
eukprot:s336_g19.t1